MQSSSSIELQPRGKMPSISHEDLASRGRRKRSSTGAVEVFNKFAVCLIVLSFFCGLVAFILCLAAEANKSKESTLVGSSSGSGSFDNGGGGTAGACIYVGGGGSSALICAAVAFAFLAVAVFLGHAYLLLIVTNPMPPDLASIWRPQPAPAPAPLPPNQPLATTTTRSLAWQSFFLFLSTWVCFAITETFLMMGIVVESGRRFDSSNNNGVQGCAVLRQGVFAASGVLSLLTVTVGAALCRTTVRLLNRARDDERLRLPLSTALRIPPQPSAPLHPRFDGLQPPHHEVSTAAAAAPPL